eukprot:CAMPEP_0198138764 /NCGR_PEP_ID=MMETSP1443-20131203/2168_1 /TAXON_ID=186043 /ORGANISM="Entomoneis sp., Strain CCMP2396" /LENGTH=433 /DNA_ID=CAMNT_0043800691 /DNA_START=19 /DNA_END=1316 /DNA_ORIENTATION=-
MRIMRGIAKVGLFTCFLSSSGSTVAWADENTATAVDGSPIEAQPILKERHSAPFERRKADTAYPTTATTMLMLSPCRPDFNGYFGSTSKKGSTTFEYNFELDTSTGGDTKIDKILRVVDDAVMDAALAHTFPAICAFQEQQQRLDTGSRHSITGFYFGDEKSTKHIQQEPCKAIDSDSTCKRYSATVVVFGKGTEASIPSLSPVMFQAIEESMTRIEKFGATRVQSLGAVITIISNGTDDNGDFMPGTTVLVSVLLLIFVLILGAICTVIYIHMRRSSSSSSSRPDFVGKKFPCDGGRGGEASTMASTALESLLYYKSTGSRMGESTLSSPSPSPSDRRQHIQQQQQQSFLHNVGVAVGGSDLSSVHVNPQRGTNRKMEQHQRVIIEFADSYESSDGDSSEESSVSPESYFQDAIPPSYLDSDGRYLEEFLGG